MAILALAAVVPLWKLFAVIVSDGESLAGAGAVQGVREFPIAALRGPILDRNGAELAISLPRVRIAADARALGRLAADDPRAEGRFVASLAGITDATEEELMARLDGSGPDDPWVKLVDAATPEQAEQARSVLTEEGLLPALVLEDTSVRVHPAGESGLRIVGTLGTDGPGPGAGVERMLDEELQGVAGAKVFEQSPTGEVIAGSEQVMSSPVAGATVHLTLDRTLQYEVERVLLRGAQAAGANGGIAIVGRPNTGELLAVAGVERDPESGQLRLATSAKAFSDAHQAGSVFKLVPVSAAIEDGHVGIDSAISVPGSIQLWDRTFTDHDPHPTEAMTVREIVANSSNVGTIKMAQMVGRERLHGALVDFGFGSRTGIAHPAESTGLLPEPDLWNGPDIAASAIGTLQSATAVQLWSAYNVIANDGMYVAPQLVERVERSDGTLVEADQGDPRRVVSEQTAEQVEQALGAVLTEGTAKRWDIPGFPAAAKTGTSRMPSPERTNAEDGYIWPDGNHHWLNAFTGYLPLDDPQLSITVLLEDVDYGLTGSTGAGPVFSELARLGIRELGIAPSESAVPGADGEDGQQSTRLRAAPASVATTSVPPAGDEETSPGDSEDPVSDNETSGESDRGTTESSDGESRGPDG